MALRHRDVVSVAVAVVLATFAVVTPVAAAGATVRIDPGSKTVAQGSTFTLHVIENYSGTTSGTQATVTFDQTKLQIQSMQRGAPYANAPIVSPADLSAAIAPANGSGQLSMVMATFMPPTTLPAGDQDFLDITFKATGCGQTSLSLPVSQDGTGAMVLDADDATIPEVQTSGSSVTINGCDGSQGGGDNGQPAAQSSDQGGSVAQVADGQSTPGEGNPAAQANDNGTIDSGNQGAGNTNPTGGSGPTGRTSLPLWLPIALAIPAVAVIWLGLRKWRLAELE